MKYPCLVPKSLCKTEIGLRVIEGVNKYGEPNIVFKYAGKCNYQSKARRVLSDDKVVVEISATALFPGDICPDIPSISGGKAVVFGVESEIYKGQKHRNPDGTVNYTEVLLI